jgi:hypothetical protein
MVIFRMATNSARKLPWTNKMRRLRSSGEASDWMAPEQVVARVQHDYLAALEWMQESHTHPWTHQWRGAAERLAGGFLRRYHHLLLRQRSEREPLMYGVLRADHTLEVRGFSEDGRHCWIIDHQSGRRIATYTVENHERLNTQDMGDGAVVMQMIYDPDVARWKIESLVQELPLGWQQRRKLKLSPEHLPLPKRIGRDN